MTVVLRYLLALDRNIKTVSFGTENTFGLVV